MNKRNTGSRHSEISRRILTQYLFSVLGYLAAVFAAYFFAWFVCSRFLWRADDPLYYLLKALQSLSPLLIVLLLVVGILLLTYHFLSKPLSYLDEVIAAAERLSQPTEEAVRLSPAMKGVEDEMNLVREQALRSAAAAREAEQRKSDLIVYLAHDLKTPLTSVIGYLTLLEEEPQISPALRAKYTGIALEKARRLEDLINEFFEITRFNLSHLELDKETVNLSRMAEQVTSEFTPLLEEKGLSWQLSIAPEVQVSCDTDKLSRVFDNLLRNAVNYSYPQTPLAVSLAPEGDMAVLRVSNHGKTIPPEKLDRLFEQFFRLDFSRATDSGGAGLGLAIAKEIVEAHGGAIQAQSQAETVIFTVCLPLSR